MEIGELREAGVGVGVGGGHTFDCCAQNPWWWSVSMNNCRLWAEVLIGSRPLLLVALHVWFPRPFFFLSFFLFFSFS